MIEHTQSSERGGQPFEADPRIGGFELDPEYARQHVIGVAEGYIREALREQLGPYVAANAVAGGVQSPNIYMNPSQVPLYQQFDVAMTSMDSGYAAAINGLRPTQDSTLTTPERDTFNEMMTGANLGDGFNNAVSNSDLTPPESSLTSASNNV